MRVFFTPLPYYCGDGGTSWIAVRLVVLIRLLCGALTDLDEPMLWRNHASSMGGAPQRQPEN
jgi:hypothetical protein